MNHEIAASVRRINDEIARADDECQDLASFVRRNLRKCAEVTPEWLLHEDGIEELLSHVVGLGCAALGLDPDARDWSQNLIYDIGIELPAYAQPCDCDPRDDEDIRIALRDGEWRIWCCHCGRRHTAGAIYRAIDDWNHAVRK